MTELTENFLRIQKELTQLESSKNFDFEDFKRSDLNLKIKNEIEKIPEANRLRLEEEFFGFGPLENILNLEGVSEIVINGPEDIFFERHGVFHQHEDKFLSLLTYNHFVQRLCSLAKVFFTLNHPAVDAQWKNFRLHIIAPPLVKDFPRITLRRHLETPWTFRTLQENNWASENHLRVLKKILVEEANFLVIGPTGCGKTAALNACMQELHPLERVLIIEDTDELTLPNRISTKLKTRIDLNHQLQNFEQFDLLKQALRMRPHRLVLGEVRGAEAKDLMLALSTGHRGSMCSLHASDARQALIRLEMLVQLGAAQWPIEAIRRLIALSIDYIVCLKMTDGRRHLSEIHRVGSAETTGITTEKIF